MDAYYLLLFEKKMYELASEQRKLSERYHEQMQEFENWVYVPLPICKK